MKKAKRYLPIYAGVASAAYLVAFLLTYESEVLGAPSAVRYLCELLAVLTDTLVPLCAAALLLPRLTAYTRLSLLWHTLPVAIPVIIRRFPDMYLLLLDGGLDSLESRRAECQKRILTHEMRPSTPFESGCPWSGALLIFALPHTALTWIGGIVDTVTFLCAYFTSFTLGEIAYMAVSLVFPPLALILSLYVAMRLCMRITAEQTEPPHRPA